MRNILRTFILSILLGGILLAAACLGAFFFILHNRYVDFSILENYNPGRPTILLDDQGNEWARFQLDRREPVPFEQMPPHLIHAFVATEDWAFFSHSGISFKGIVRSTVVNLYHGRKVQGASTITQQLVKLLFFNAKKTFKRKIQEQIYAILVEHQFTKQQIMQTYLNHIYFGCGIYGVQAASQRFWGKNASELTIAESASLAAIIRSPANYCPILCPLSCAKRRDLILHSMCTLGHITPEQCTQALNTPLTIKSDETQTCAPHLKELIRLFLEKQVGRKALYQDGLIVQTTLNKKTQEEAQKAFTAQLNLLKDDWLPEVNGALITLDTHSGAIKALIGGSDFYASKFNRALHAKRQIGSTFKPLVYAAAIQNGATFADTEVDEPLTMPHAQGALWQPNNVTNTFNGQMTLAHALSYSNNIISIKCLLKAGIPTVVDLALRCGLSGPIHPYPSIALGCVDAPPVEVAGMFNIFANDGIYVQPHYISWIKDQWGNKIYKDTPVQKRVLPSRIVGQVAKVLSLGLERVKKKSPQKWISCQAIGKTGTTSDFKTCWFVGSTPELTTAIYIGRDDGQQMGKGVFPLRTAFPIWLNMHTRLSCTQEKFVFDPSLREVTIHEKTGQALASTSNNPEAITIFV
jgi:penicillin-binding protein 1A